MFPLKRAGIFHTRYLKGSDSHNTWNGAVILGTKSASKPKARYYVRPPKTHYTIKCPCVSYIAGRFVASSGIAQHSK